MTTARSTSCSTPSPRSPTRPTRAAGSPTARANTRPALAHAAAAPDGPWLEFAFRENPAAVDLAYAVETSADLAGWTPLVIDGVNVVSETEPDGAALRRRVRVKVPAVGEPSRFLRLRVTR